MEILGALGVIAVMLILTGGYFLCVSYARVKALKSMLFIEIYSQEYSLNLERQKFLWVVSQYDSLPSIVKFIISKHVYRSIVSDEYDYIFKRDAVRNKD